MIFERRLLSRDRGAGILEKLWQIPWVFVLLLCGVRRIRDARVLTLEAYYPDATADAGFNERPGADNAEL